MTEVIFLQPWLLVVIKVIVVHNSLAGVLVFVLNLLILKTVAAASSSDCLIPGFYCLVPMSRSPEASLRLTAEADGHGLRGSPRATASQIPYHSSSHSNRLHSGPTSCALPTIV